MREGNKGREAILTSAIKVKWPDIILSKSVDAGNFLHLPRLICAKKDAQDVHIAKSRANYRWNPDSCFAFARWRRRYIHITDGGRTTVASPGLTGVIRGNCLLGLRVYKMGYGTSAEALPQRACLRARRKCCIGQRTKIPYPCEWKALTEVSSEAITSLFNEFYHSNLINTLLEILIFQPNTGHGRDAPRSARMSYRHVEGKPRLFDMLLRHMAHADLTDKVIQCAIKSRRRVISILQIVLAARPDFEFSPSFISLACDESDNSQDFRQF